MNESQVKKFIADGIPRTLEEIMYQSGDLIRGFTTRTSQRQEVGPVRRGEESVRAIELLLTHPYKSIRPSLVGSLNLRCTKIDMSNENIWTMIYYDNRVVLYFATSMSFIAQMLIRTGPDDFVTSMKRRARAEGYRLDVGGFWRGNDLIKPFDESAIFQALGLQYVPPQERAAETIYEDMER